MKKILSLLTFLVMFLATSFAATTDPLCFTAEEAGVTVGFKIEGTLSSIPELQYSTNGSTWSDYDLSDAQQITLSSVGDKVYFRAKTKNSTFSIGDYDYISFTSTAKIAASGNIMSLLDNTCEQTIVPEYAFIYLFKDCKGLTSAPELPATTLQESSYDAMFYNCTSLSMAPKLPAMSLKTRCYNRMFSGCKNLTTPPELPATTLAPFCYQFMFCNCEKLEYAPKLPATTIETHCYAYMFVGCDGLTTAPELPATKMEWRCYYNMFGSCDGLTTAPKLPALELEKECYTSMFCGCDNLTTPPELPATKLAEGCYYSMFWKCTNLTTAPILPAKTLAKECYVYMFWECPKLSNITAYFNDWNTAEASTKNWVKSVSPTGTFNCPAKFAVVQYGDSYIPSGWTLKKGNILPKNCFRIGAYYADTKVYFSKSGTLNKEPSLIYTTDEGKTWNKYTFDTKITLEKTTSEVCFMAEDTNGSFSQSDQDYIRFFATNPVYSKGSIMSLLDNTCAQATVPDHAFYRLFFGANVATSPALPALTVGYESYCEMFKSSALQTAPELPATKLDEHCYRDMFRDCTKLRIVPKELPAKNVRWYSYFSMFKNCTSITESPFIAAETLFADSDGCTEACGQMFQGCTQLSKVNVAFTKWDDSTVNWLDGVSATGTFTCPATLDISTRGVDTVPTGWNIVQTGEANPTIVDLAKLIDSIKKGGSSTINDVNTLKNKILKK